MRVLLTGAYGFAGHHFIEHCLNTTDWDITALYSFRHLGCPLRADVVRSSRVSSVYHDLNSAISGRLSSKIGKIDFIVNMAAWSHVERSISDPVPFVQNNVNVALNILEYARTAQPKAFVQVSTDEVYGPALLDDKHAEWREFLPSNPYAASKVAQEAIAISYWRTYGVPLIITNTMNMIGPRQDPEKFVPMCIKKILNNEEITIHGVEGNVGSRQYLHAKGHADGIIWLLKNTEAHRYFDDHEVVQKPGRYNIVGKEEINNLDMARRLAYMLKKPIKYRLIDFHSARPGHDRRYALDGLKMEDLGWENPFDINTTLQEIVDYAVKYPEWTK